MPRAPDRDAGDVAKTRARSLAGLSWVNFFVALMQTSFGAFLAVDLTASGWSRTDLGFVLSAGTLAAIAAQVPGGLLVDWVASKRLAAGGAILATAAAAALIAVRPTHWPVITAEVMQGAASAVLTPAIAAITLSLSPTDALGERLGRNVRYAAVGATAAAALMGLVGAWVSHRAIFWLAAAAVVPALLALAAIHPGDLASAHRRTSHLAAVPPHLAPGPPHRKWHVAGDRRLLALAGCVLLFQLGNAALLPTAAAAATDRLARLPAVALPVPGLAVAVSLRLSDLLVAAWIVVPQLLAAVLSPWLGALAQRHGRRLVLLTGLAALPVRALLFAAGVGPLPLTAAQALDGVSAAALGMIVPLVVADVTHRRGRFNLALGEVGLAGCLGATLSTALAGVIADRAGTIVTFLALAAAGLCGLLSAWALVPETRAAAASHPAAARPVP